MPRQHSTGGRDRLLGISKRGDVYLRQLLIHGARAVLRWVERKDDPTSRWAAGLKGRRHTNVAVVALANKIARIAYAVMTTGKAISIKDLTRPTSVGTRRRRVPTGPRGIIFPGNHLSPTIPPWGLWPTPDASSVPGTEVPLTTHEVRSSRDTHHELRRVNLTVMAGKTSSAFPKT